jgi:hypothetical protein
MKTRLFLHGLIKGSQMGSKETKEVAKQLVQLYRSTVLGRRHSVTVAHSKQSGRGQRLAERRLSL